MNLRYTLNNEIEGEHITGYSPKGWEETELVLKRHEKYDGIFKDYVVKAEFFCGAGKEYLDNIEETQGVEAVVTILIEIDCDDSGTYQTLYSGIIMFDTFESTSAAPQYTKVNIKQDDIVQTILSRLETKVNLSSLETLNGTTLTMLERCPYDLNLHSKTIVESALLVTEAASPQYTDFATVGTGSDMWAELPFDSTTYDELGDVIIPSAPYVSGATMGTYPDAVYTNSSGGTITLNIEYTFLGEVLESEDNNRTYNLYLKYRKGLGGFLASSEVTLINYGPKSETASLAMTQAVDTAANLSASLADGESLYIYFEFENYTGTPTIDPLVRMSFTTCEILFSVETNTPATVCKAAAVFETGAQISRVITDQADAFRSEFFGRTDSEPHEYEENGCGSFTAITNGFLIRGFSLDGINGRVLSLSMKEYFEGLSAMFCLGLGIKQSGSNTYLEVEPKEHFYTDDTLFNLSNIKNLTTKVDKKFFYNRIKIGFSEWRKSEGGSNGLDEFCTLQEYATLNKNISQTLDSVSDFVAAPYAIETTRRKQFADTPTEDTDFDDKNFIIALSRHTDYGGTPDELMYAEKAEYFTNIENVFSPETIYNLRFKPARLLRNWYKIFGTSLIKLNDTLRNVKFSFGEGNYKIISQGIEACDPAQMELVEAGQDVNVIIPAADGLEPLFTGHVDEFEVPFSLSQYQQLKELDIEGNPNYYKKIGYSTTDDDYLNGYILDLRYRPIRGKASMKMARAYERSTECSHIYVEADYVECGYVE
jgi:hypothetical protein